jgi:hypothetical protein
MLLIAIARADAARAGGFGAGWRIPDVRGACRRCEKRAVTRRTRGGYGRRLGRDGEGQTQAQAMESAQDETVYTVTPESADDLSCGVGRQHVARSPLRAPDPALCALPTLLSASLSVHNHAQHPAALLSSLSLRARLRPARALRLGFAQLLPSFCPASRAVSALELPTPAHDYDGG